MKTLIVIITLAIAGSAQAANLQFEDGVLRVVGAASGHGRSVWARGNTLVVVLPPSKLAAETLRVGRSGLRVVRVLSRRNRTDIELRLDRPAERMMGKVELREDGVDLLVVIDRKAAAAAAERRAEQARQRARAAADAAAAKAAKAKAAKAVAKVTPPAATPAATKGAPTPAPAKLAQRPAWLRRRGMVKGDTGRSDRRSGANIWLMAGFLLVAGAVALYLRRRRGSGGGVLSGEIDVLSSRTLGSKQKLVLVAVEGERLLLACTDKDVRMLHAVRSTPAPLAAEQQDEAIFEHALRRSAVEEEAVAAAEEPIGTGRFVEQLEQQLAQARQRRVAAAQEQPLDEKWAEGIRRLRRRSASRQQERPASTARSAGFSHYVS